MSTKAKDEALRALETVISGLASSGPIEGLRRFQLKAAAEYARDQVGEIQERKRLRRGAAPA